MGFFKPAGEPEGSGDDPIAGDEGSPEEAEAVGDVDEADGELGDGGVPTDG